MTDHKTIPERADELFRRMEKVLDDYEQELERWERKDEVTEDFLGEMIAAEYYMSQFEALCELDPVGFVEKFAFIDGMIDEVIFHEVLVKGEKYAKET